MPRVSRRPVLVKHVKPCDVTGVAIHNVPGEGDVGAVPTGQLEVADNFLGSCTTRRTESVCLQRVGMLSSYCQLRTCQ